MFPSLTTLMLHDNGVSTLRDVMFPETLDALHVESEPGLSLEGAVFPKSLVHLHFTFCTNLKGLGSVRYPEKLSTLHINGCNIGWISKKLLLPGVLHVWCSEGNPNIDLRVLGRRHADTHWSRVHPATYNFMDAIALFIHNNVLPNELLRYVYENFADFEQ